MEDHICKTHTRQLGDKWETTSERQLGNNGATNGRHLRQLEGQFWETNGNCGRQLEDNFETSGRQAEDNYLKDNWETTVRLGDKWKTIGRHLDNWRIGSRGGQKLEELETQWESHIGCWCCCWGIYQHLQVLIVCDPNKMTFSVALGAKGVHFLKESWMCFAENLYPDHRTSSNQSHLTGMGLPFGES